MIYETSETVQLLALLACFAFVLVRALRVRNAAWLEVVCFFACMFLGNVYWFGYLVVFGESPQYSYVADLGWVAGYIFLLMLMVECDQRRGLTAPVPAAWLAVVACTACCVFYIVTSGDPLLNIADNGLMAALGFFAVRGLIVHPEDGLEKGFATNKPLHAAVLAFVIVEQALWLSSLIPGASPDFEIYGIFNFALTLSYIAILACAWRSAEL